MDFEISFVSRGNSVIFINYSVYIATAPSLLFCRFVWRSAREAIYCRKSLNFAPQFSTATEYRRRTFARDIIETKLFYQKMYQLEKKKKKLKKYSKALNLGGGKVRREFRNSSKRRVASFLSQLQESVAAGCAIVMAIKFTVCEGAGC